MSNEERTVLYVNVIVHDASEIVKAKFDESFPKKIPSPLRVLMAKVASDLATPTVVAERMGPKLCQKVPTKLKEKGITVEVEQVFWEGPYLVLQLQVQHVDSVKVAKSRAPEGFLGGIESAFHIIGATNKDRLERGYLPDVVQQKMESIMGEVLAEKLSEKKVEATSVVLHESKQARYFFATRQAVKLAAEVANKKKRRSNNASHKTDKVEAFSEEGSPSKKKSPRKNFGLPGLGRKKEQKSSNGAGST